MNRESRPVFVFGFGFALLIACVIGCKMSSSGSSSTSGSSTNDKSDSPKSPSSNSSSSASSSAPAPDVAGHYNVVGTNPNGATYKGTLEVITRGDVYQFRSNAGTQYGVIGVQDGKVVARPFADGRADKGRGGCGYVMNGDGALDGEW